jgi:predicted phosphodiesterase
LFHHARDNQNWLLGELLEILGRQEVIAVFGNHDCRDATLADDDSLSVILKAKTLRLVNFEGSWHGRIGGRDVVIGGSSYRQRLPEKAEFENFSNLPLLVFWMAHHDLLVPGYEEHGKMRPREIPGIDVVVNGHIHRSLEDVRTGQTLWITPGNIARVSRSDATREHTPRVLKIMIAADGSWQREMIEVPHQRFEDVFHQEVLDAADHTAGPQSAFVQGLAELQARRTESGAGLMQFLDKNIGQFEPAVREHVLTLAREVIDGNV